MKYGDAAKNWTVELDGREHSFRMEHNFWSGEKKYFVDDEMIEHVEGGLKASAAFAGDVPFSVGGHQGYFRHRAVGRAVFYDLFIDDEKIKGEEKHALRLPLWAAALLFLLLFLIAFLSMQFGKGG
jgi:hypothetical protein